MTTESVLRTMACSARVMSRLGVTTRVSLARAVRNKNKALGAAVAELRVDLDTRSGSSSKRLALSDLGSMRIIMRECHQLRKVTIQGAKSGVYSLLNVPSESRRPS